MSTLLDCSTCGGPMPAGRRCCPHCHCKNAAWKRWAIAATAAAGLGAADCGGSNALPHDVDMSTRSVDMSTGDMPEFNVEYGPAIQHDMADADAVDQGS